MSDSHQRTDGKMGVLRTLKGWVWFAREDPASAFRAGVFMTFGFLALLSCLFAIAFAVTTLVQSGSRAREETVSQTSGRRAEIQRMLTSSKMGIEERAIASTILSCMDGAMAPGANPKQPAAVSPPAPVTGDNQVRSYEMACAGKLVTEVAIAHGGERGQKIAWKLQSMGIELPPEYR